jgi:hypothetical protein
LQINFTGFTSMTISLGSYDQGVANTSANSNSFSTFLVTDTFTLAPPLGETTPPPSIVINGDTGDVNFAVYDSHAVMTINGGTGNDNFYVFGNSQILNLNGDLDFSSNNGDEGNDDFYVFASLVASQNQVTNVDGGVNSSAVYNYRMNALVDINGGSGNTSLFVFLTVLDDVVTVSGSTIQGSGLNIQYSHIKNIIIDSLSGDDVFYVEGVSIPMQLFGGGGLPAFPAGIPVPNLNGAPTQILTLGTSYVSQNGWRAEPAGCNHNADPGC